MASKGAHHAETHHPLSYSMGQVALALKANYGDALGTNWKALLQDRAFCLFLVTSVSCFGASSVQELMRLMKKRKEKASIVAVANKPDKPKTKRPKKISADGQFFKHLGFLLKIAIPKPYSRGGQLLMGHFLLLVMKTFLTVRCSKLTVYFLTRAIAAASWIYWIRWVFSFIGWTIGGVIINSGLKYMESQVALEIRRKLTRHIHENYMKNNNFYATSSQGLDNPDQRITADIADFASKAASLFGHSFTPALNFVLSLAEASKDLGLKRPLALFGWNMIVNGTLQSFCPALAPMVNKEQGLEGDFRHAHTRLITHAEEVAFLDGASTERAILNGRLDQLIDTKAWHALKKISKDFADQFFKFQSLMAGGIFIHVPFMVSQQLTEAQRISAFRSTEELMLRCGTAFGDMLLVGRKMDELAGYTHRIMQLFKAFEAPKHDPVSNGSPLAPGPVDCIEFDSVSVSAPEPDGSKRLLVQDLQLTVGKGKNVLVTGPNGCGKTSLFRVLAGLWPATAGCVRAPLGDVMWLPQKPYLVMGTLRDQVTYPVQLGFQKVPSVDEKVLKCLEMAGITKLTTGPEGLSRIHEEWNDVLSGGERQRIGFARLYYHEPAFAVLDESTSAINPDEEMLLYEKVVTMGTTVFSIAHRLELRKFHQYELKVAGDGTGKWELLEL